MLVRIFACREATYHMGFKILEGRVGHAKLHDTTHSVDQRKAVGSEHLKI